MNTPRFSIIIPIYNKEQYLHRCLDSVLSQTYADFEALLVDDGSMDNSGAICDEYAAKDSCIRVFHKPNGGVSTARNLGLDNTRGEWVCFVDADDWLDDSYLQNFVDAMKPDTEIVLQSFWFHNASSDSITIAPIPDMQMHGNYRLVKWLEEAKTVHNGFIWHRCFRNEIIKRENARFPECVSMAEDGWFWYGYLRNVQNIVFTSKPGYHYVMGNDGSLTALGRKLPISITEQIIRNYTELLISFKLLEKEKKGHIRFVHKYMWRFICDNLYRCSFVSDNALMDMAALGKRLVSDYHYDDTMIYRPSVWLIQRMLTSSNQKLPTISVLRFALAIRKNEIRILSRL